MFSIFLNFKLYIFNNSYYYTLGLFYIYITRLTYPRIILPRYKGFLGTRANLEGFIFII